MRWRVAVDIFMFSSPLSLRPLLGCHNVSPDDFLKFVVPTSSQYVMQTHNKTSYHEYLNIMTGVYDTALSDHYLIYTVFSKSFVRKERAHKEIKFRNYRKFSPEEFRKELLENDSITNTDWPEHMLSEKWDKFKNAFLTVSNKCAPFETRRLKNRNNPNI